MNLCKFWGANRSDEHYTDTGCILGRAWCDHAQCKDFQEIRRRTPKLAREPVDTPLSKALNTLTDKGQAGVCK